MANQGPIEAIGTDRRSPSKIDFTKLAQNRIAGIGTIKTQGAKGPSVFANYFADNSSSSACQNTGG